MAREGPAKLRGMHLQFDMPLCLPIEDERRRYVQTPSFQGLMRPLLREALATRASLRMKLEQRTPEPWKGPEAASSPPPPRGRKEERIHRRLVLK
jgi:hypothetical protein